MTRTKFILLFHLFPPATKSQLLYSTFMKNWTEATSHNWRSFLIRNYVTTRQFYKFPFCYEFYIIHLKILRCQFHIKCRVKHFPTEKGKYEARNFPPLGTSNISTTTNDRATWKVYIDIWKTCCFLPNDGRRRDALGLAVKSDVSVSFDADVHRFDQPSRWYWNKG